MHVPLDNCESNSNSELNTKFVKGHYEDLLFLEIIA
jgi:hypothetical protein